MTVSDEILAILNSSKLHSESLSIDLLGLPLFKNRKKNTVYHGLDYLRKKNYVTFSGSHLVITKAGRQYLRRRAARLRIFDSPFHPKSPKNLLLVFDIPEKRKAEREWLRFQLRKYSYFMIQRSVWVGPSPLPKEFVKYLKNIRIADSIRVFYLNQNYSDIKSRKL